MSGSLGVYSDDDLSLFTDFYELSMCAVYFEDGRFEPVTFDLFVRRFCENRSYFLFAGLEQVLLYLQSVKFSERHIDYLRQRGFSSRFLDYLRGFRFSGDVWAVLEGSVVFPNEPLIRVTAPLIEAQLVETFLLNAVNLQTTMATKASRVVHAACGRPVIEFGLRREHGVDAGMKVARSSYIAGCMGTSNVLAGMSYGIPVFGTMAHSFVMSYPKELDAFHAFVNVFPENSTLLIDTYDDLAGLEKAITVAKELELNGFRLGGVRLDSGELVETSKTIRKILDVNGLGYVKIFVSGDMDEFRIAQLLREGAKIDLFGVGTKMGTSSDRPYLDVVYKLCEIITEPGVSLPIMKLSPDKSTLPGRKQVYRYKDAEGNYVKDVIALDSEEIVAEPLLVNVMCDGKINYSFPSLSQIRALASENLSHLPEKYKAIVGAEVYPVVLSENLQVLSKDLHEKLVWHEILDQSGPV